MRPSHSNPSATYPFPNRPPIPPEHGGWAMLFISMALGIALSPNRDLIEATQIGLGLVFIYLARYPLTLIAMRFKWIRIQHRDFLRERLVWFFAYLAVAAIFLWWPAVSLSEEYRVGGGVLGFLLLVFEMFTVANQQQKTLWSEVVGSIAVAFLGALTLALLTSTLDLPFLRLWVLLILHYVPGVFYVRMRIRSSRTDAHLPNGLSKIKFAIPAMMAAGAALCMVGAGVITHHLPPVILLAYGITLPRLFFGIGQLGKKFPVKQLGWSEVGHTLAFAIIVSLAGI